MTAVVLLILAIVLGGGLGLIWRRLDELHGEIRALRAALEAQQSAPGGPRPGQSAPGATVTPLSRPVVVRVAGASPAPAPESDEPTLFPISNPSDDPFDDSWVIKNKAPTQQQQAQRAAITRAGTDLTRAPVIQAPMAAPAKSRSFERSDYLTPELKRVLAACAALLTPAIALAFGAPAAPVAAVALGLVIACLFVSLRTGFAALAWIAAAFAAGWTLWAAADGILAEASPWSAVALAALGAAALAHAAITRLAAPGGMIALTVAAGCFALGASDLNAALVALAAVVVGAALVGASFVALEHIHVGAWVSAGIALYLLQGRADAAQIWFAPAAAWLGALFLGIAAVRAPRLGAKATVLAATGTTAAIFAVYSIHASRYGLTEPWAAALAFVAVAAALACMLAQSARAAGAIEALGWAAFPLGFGAASSFTLALLIALPAPLGATGFATAAGAALLLNARYAHPLWRFTAALLGVGAIVQAIMSLALFLDADTFALAATILCFGIAAPAVLALGGAWAASDRAPVTAMAFEAGAIALATLALSGFVRALMAGGPASASAVTYAEAGLHAAAWLGLAFLLAARSGKGAWLVRRFAAIALVGGALAVLAAGPLTALNPLWGVWREPVAGVAVFNLLLAGYAAPAALIWGAYAFWRGHAAAPFALGAAAVLTAAWIGLEIRRGFHGPELALGATGYAEIGIYVAATGAAVIAASLARAALARNATG